MKYQINESRLDKIIDNYLASELNNLKPFIKDDEIIWFVNELGEPIIISNKAYGKDILVLVRDVYDNLEKLFGLNTTDDIQAQLRKYFYLHWGLVIKMIYTFNRENVAMV